MLNAGITNIKDEWPLGAYDLYRYVEDKYGVTKMNDIHHYETVEIRDNRGRLILPPGQKVAQNFTIRTPYNASDDNFYIAVKPLSENQYYRGVNQDINPVVGISNYEYETIKNEDKREIDIMKPSYLQQFLNDMRTLMNYDESSLTINKKLMTTENTRLIT